MKFKEDKSKQYFNHRFAKTFVDQQKWKLYKYVLMRHYASYDKFINQSDNQTYAIRKNTNKCSLEDNMPIICATCFVSRQPQYYYWNAYFLTFLITISSFNLFSIDCKLPQNRLQNNFLLLLTSISFKWVVNRSLPTVSYLTSLDLYGIVNIFFLCLLAAWHAIVGSCWDPKYANYLDHVLLVVFAVLFVLIQLTLIIRLLIPYAAIKRLRKKENDFLKTLKTIPIDKNGETSVF